MDHRNARRLLRACGASLVFVLAPLSVTCAAAQSPGEMAAMKQDIETLKAGQAALKKDIDEIKAILRPAPQKQIIDAPPDVILNIEGRPARGAAGARLVLVEFSDYECPFCGKFVRDTLPQIDAAYVTPGKVLHVFRSFPLDSIHPNALKAHEAAACAGEQDKYWLMHARLFQNQRALTPPDLLESARSIGLDQKTFQQCLDSGRMTDGVKKDQDAGMKLGITGTPMFLIGIAGANGEVQVKKAISGAVPFAVFKQAFDDVLAGK